VTVPYAKRRCLLGVFPRSTEPVKFRVNLARPLAKPKYSLVTDHLPNGPAPKMDDA